MNFEPQKFFVGLMDFFSILLPGALATFLLADVVGPTVLPARKLEGAAGWAVFLFASYLLGHLVFLLGSWFDSLYEALRCRTMDRQIRYVALRGTLSPWPLRTFVWSIFKDDRNLSFGIVQKIKERALAPLNATQAINTFQWSKALLTIEDSPALALVQRFEADSKFFRCFAVVMLFILAAWPWQQPWPVIGIPIVALLFLLAMGRYMEQRLKSINQAYWAVITLASQGKIASARQTGSEAATAPGPAARTRVARAGGVVLRMRGGASQYLLVQASADTAQWVLPKGHVEPGETQHEAAIREVHEETGVWASIGVRPTRSARQPAFDHELAMARRRTESDMGSVSYVVDGEEVCVRFFLMHAIGRGRQQDRGRGYAWMPFELAVKRASHPETRALIEAAEHRRIRWGST